MYCNLFKTSTESSRNLAPPVHNPIITQRNGQIENAGFKMLFWENIFQENIDS
jgi:hypothetical protein